MDSLGNYMSAEARVYDQIQKQKDLKYVSVTLQLNENYLEQEESFAQLNATTVSFLLSKFPAGTFVGQVKYVYQESGKFQSRTIPLDWRKQEL